MSASKLIFVRNTTGATETSFVIGVPPISAFFDLLDDVTEAEIRRETPAEIAERAAYAEAGGIVLARDIAPRRR